MQLINKIDINAGLDNWLSLCLLPCSIFTTIGETNLGPKNFTPGDDGKKFWSNAASFPTLTF